LPPDLARGRGECQMPKVAEETGFYL